jgi:5-formyltetrahydrofolate cyclo-ligase
MDTQIKAEKDLLVFERLITLPEFIGAELVLTYVSTKLEVDTRRLISHCFAQSKHIAIPIIIDDKMRFFHTCDIGEAGEIGEEATSLENKNSICVVPALAYNDSRFRLGYGGGYYDRFLSEYSGYSVGICYSEFIMDIPTQEHDERVDKVLTD